MNWRLYNRNVNDYQSIQVKLNKTIEMILADPAIQAQIKQDREKRKRDGWFIDLDKRLKARYTWNEKAAQRRKI
jgi:hypothetical protein